MRWPLGCAAPTILLVASCVKLCPLERLAKDAAAEKQRAPSDDGATGNKCASGTILILPPPGTAWDCFYVEHPIVVEGDRVRLSKPLPRRHTIGFAEGLAQIWVGGKVGFVDESFRIVIEPRFDYAGSFSEGYATVQVGDKYGYIDKTGNYVLSPQFDYAYRVQGGLGSVKVDGLFGLIRMDGTWVVEPRYNGGLVPVQGGFLGTYLESGKEEFLNLSGQRAELPLGEACAPNGFINISSSRTRTLGLPPEFHPIIVEADKVRLLQPLPRRHTISFAEGLAQIWVGGKVGFVDESLRIVIEPRFDYAGSFSEGYATVQVGGKYGYIDKTGNYVLSPQFDYAYRVQGGLGSVKVDGLFGLIRMDGTWVVEPRYNHDLVPIQGGFLGKYLCRGKEEDEVLDLLGQVVGSVPRNTDPADVVYQNGVVRYRRHKQQERQPVCLW